MSALTNVYLDQCLPWPMSALTNVCIDQCLPWRIDLPWRMSALTNVCLDECLPWPMSALTNVCLDKCAKPSPNLVYKPWFCFPWQTLDQVDNFKKVQTCQLIFPVWEVEQEKYSNCARLFTLQFILIESKKEKKYYTRLIIVALAKHINLFC